MFADVRWVGFLPPHYLLFYRTSYLMRRSTVLSRPLQLVFHGYDRQFIFSTNSTPREQGVTLRHMVRSYEGGGVGLGLGVGVGGGGEGGDAKDERSICNSFCPR